MPLIPELSDDAVRELQADLRLWHRLDLTPEQTAELILSSEHLKRDLLRMRFPDTTTRELAIDLLSRRFTGRDWPLIAARGSYDEEKFFSDFYSRAREAGYGVVEQEAP